MNKLLVLSVGTFAASAAIASTALLSPAVAGAEPSAVSLNVVGEPYGKAVSILKSQGVKGVFGGSRGSDLPQAQCIVDSQTVRSNKFVLMLDCTAEAARDAAGSVAAPSAPTAGAPGAPGAPAPQAGQGTYGNPIGVPVPVG